MVHLVAFAGEDPFPLVALSIRGHNFPETIEFRDRMVEKTGLN